MNAYAKSLAATATVSLLVSSALADPMHSPKLLAGGRTRQSNPEAVFVPITPCRAFKGQQLTAGTPRRFTISGPTGPCGVPASATAVAISLTTTSNSGNGSISAYPYGMPSSTTALTFYANRDETASVTVGVADEFIVLRANGSSTKIAGDVTGYYAQQIDAYLTSEGGLATQTARVLSSTHTSGTGVYTVVIDRDVTNCVAQVTPFRGQATGYTDGNTVFVSTYNSAGTANDEEFNVSVIC
jgi:hypothetical protein